MDVKPIVVVSRCLGFEACRYNGQILSDSFVDRLAPHVEYRTVCPEVQIGMGIPRPAVKIVVEGGVPTLRQHDSGEDFSDSMNAFADQFLKDLGDVDGFILKGRSPSCALKDAKLHTMVAKGPGIGKGPGLFGAKVLAGCGGLALEDEGRLNNDKIREHFLIKLFALARFRLAKKKGTVSALMEFQTTHKLVLMAYNQTLMRKMGKLLGQADKKGSFKDVAAQYETDLHHALIRPARNGSHINALMHALGYFSKELKSTEKALFLEHLESYRNEKIPLITLLSLLRSWTLRFETEYLMKQCYLNPYPEL